MERYITLSTFANGGLTIDRQTSRDGPRLPMMSTPALENMGLAVARWIFGKQTRLQPLILPILAR